LILLVSFYNYDKQNSNNNHDLVLSTLIKKSYIRVATLAGHQSPQDRLMSYEAEEKRNISGIPTSKQLKEAHEKAIARMKMAEDSENNSNQVRSILSRLLFH
jgi:DNA-directed RNA polymerase III subunit RPC3